ncbi:hypothetical protein CVD28_22650 [Bacillus sp. M6-12]|nr:hypothetical protein CVD28_22650 [Bacillus sp. M6-12]
MHRFFADFPYYSSSPWVEKYIIIEKKTISEKEVEFKVQLDLVDSTGSLGSDIALVGVVKKDDKWYVSRVAPGSKKTIGFWNTPDSINLRK